MTEEEKQNGVAAYGAESIKVLKGLPDITAEHAL